MATKKRGSIGNRHSFWHPAPKSVASAGTNKPQHVGTTATAAVTMGQDGIPVTYQEDWNTSRTVLPPIDYLPSLSFEETFVRGNNFGKPLQSNIAIQASARDIKHAQDHELTNRGGGGGKMNYLKGVIEGLRYDVRLKQDEIAHLNKTIAQNTQDIQQLTNDKAKLEVSAEQCVGLEKEVKEKDLIIMEQTKTLDDMKVTHKEQIQQLNQKCIETVEEHKSQKISSVEEKEAKIKELKQQVSAILDQSSNVRSDQLMELRDALVKSKRECKQLQREVQHYKDSCPSCIELRTTLQKSNEEIESLKETEDQLKTEIEDLRHKLQLQSELKVTEMEQVRSIHTEQMSGKDDVIRKLKTQVTSVWDKHSRERGGELRRMQKSLEMTENENNNLISENTVLNRRLTNAVDAIRQLKSALRLMKEQKLKLADLLVSSQEEAHQMQRDYENELDELYERLGDEEEDEDDDQNIETQLDQGHSRFLPENHIAKGDRSPVSPGFCSKPHSSIPKNAINGNDGNRTASVTSNPNERAGSKRSKPFASSTAQGKVKTGTAKTNAEGER
ncbi:uncharacterized protein LOC142351908 [Convolutriloba macropyga]|uniref:uncharacterized protein LOC142351908 n=1 Tax=Convolutriloba macropyga TaxID=536237 RepID=UPI003F527F12